VNPIAIGALVLVCTFGGALAGMRLKDALPKQHLESESSNTIKVGIGLVATMTALVLGLVTGSAKGSFETISSDINQTANELITLDRVLARYGPDAAEVRRELSSLVASRMAAIWPADGAKPQLDVADFGRAEAMIGRIQSLAPQTEEQRWLRSRALDLGEAVLQARWIATSGHNTAVLLPFVAALLFWLSMTFMSFGLFAPRNATVVAVLFVCALSVAGAVFLVLEMDGPFDGLVRVSPQPLQYVLSQMNR
jgi:hypothetical protein